MKTKAIPAAMLITMLCMVLACPDAMAEHPRKEWITMFNGKNFDGWRGYNRTDIPKSWTIEDGALKINRKGSPVAGSDDRGDIVFDQKLKNFEFEFKYRVSKGANSGIFYLAQELQGKAIYRSAPEYQVLDNENHPDAKMGKNGNRQSASLYDLIPAVPQSSKPYGEWNEGKIVVNDGVVTHYLNGKKVVEYQLWTNEWETMIDGSKFKGWTEMIQTGGPSREGLIGLQDHSDDVWFKDLRIRQL